MRKECIALLFLGWLASGSASEGCRLELTDPSGFIASPGYPQFYPPDVDCHWSIIAPPTRKIKLFFNDFHLENVEDCFPGGPGDYLLITDSDGETHTFCGQNHPWVFESKGNTLYVTFVSDSDDQHGFRFGLTYVSASQCEEGWEEFGEHCYFFSDEELIFDEASADCLGRNAQLASVHSREEQEFLQRHSKRGTLFIGAVNTGDLMNDSFSFEFLDGSPNDYHNVYEFDRFEPLNCESRPLDCGIVLVPHRWANRDCSETRPVICHSVESHGEDWYCLDDLCFHVSTRAFVFDAGRSYCQEFDGADVVSVGGNERMLSAIALGFEAYFPHPLPEWNEHWIGLRRGVGGDWGWMDGNDFTLDRWDEGYPAEGGGDCAVVVASSWDDLTMEWAGSFVCKKSP